jgi:hypothetical protein
MAEDGMARLWTTVVTGTVLAVSLLALIASRDSGTPASLPMHNATPSDTPAAENNASEFASAPETDTEPLVSVEGQRLDVHVRERELGWLLDEIARQSGVSIVNNTGAADQKVSAILRDIDLDTGLQQLLAEWDVFIYYTQAPDPMTVQSVWIYPKGRGRDLAPGDRLVDTAPVAAPPGSEAGSNQASVTDPLIDTLLEQEDDSLRLRNLEQALNTAADVPRALLEEMLLADPSERIRARALEGLVDAPEATPKEIRSLAELALADSSETVRALAGQILGRLEVLEQADLVSGQADSGL